MESRAKYLLGIIICVIIYTLFCAYQPDHMKDYNKAMDTQIREGWWAIPKALFILATHVYLVYCIHMLKGGTKVTWKDIKDYFVGS